MAYSNRDPAGVGRNRDSRRTSGYRSLLDVRATIATDDANAVYHTDGDASVNLCLSQPAA